MDVEGAVDAATGSTTDKLADLPLLYAELLGLVGMWGGFCWGLEGGEEVGQLDGAGVALGHGDAGFCFYELVLFGV